MEQLVNIIKENIKWFWANDPLVKSEKDISKLWDGFRVWCVQNCFEVVNMNMKVIEQTVDACYGDWLEMSF